MNEVIVSMNNISKSFPGVKALDHVKFELRSGEVMALLGENGAGKSTLMKILSGVYTRDEGTMEIFGKSYDNLTPKQAQEAGVAIIHQELNMCRHLTVTENMFLGREVKGGLSLNNAKMRKEAKKVLDDLRIDISPDQIVGFAGLMGAGRTETTRAIFGVDPKDSGEFYVDGKKIEVNCPMDAIRNGVVLAPEDRKKDGLCTKLSIRQNLALPNLDLVCNKMGVINSGKEDALCEKAVKDLQIKTPNVEIDSGNLSGGNQQKVVVGKWLARDSRVVIFDEPTRGIDVGAKVEIYNLMNELKKQGIAVMFVSSEMPEVMGIADRIIVMCDGRITGEVSAREATQDEILTMATSFENKSIKETEGGSKNE